MKLLSDNPRAYDDAALEGIRRILAEEGGDARGGPDGHDRRHQRPARAQGRAASRWRSRAASATRCASATRRGPRFSRGTSCCRRCSTSGGRDRRAGRRRRDGRPPARRGRGAGRARARSAPRAIDALAIVLMHGWRFTDHEARLAAIARELGFAQVSVSHEVAPLIKLVGARRHDRGRRLSVAGPAPLRRPRRGAGLAPTRRCNSCSRTAG